MAHLTARVSQLLAQVRPHAQELEPIRAADAKRACLSFKERTTRPSGMHPRHPGWARDQEGLAMLLNLCEQVGAFPTSEREVLISL